MRLEQIWLEQICDDGTRPFSHLSIARFLCGGTPTTRACTPRVHAHHTRACTPRVHAFPSTDDDEPMPLAEAPHATPAPKGYVLKGAAATDLAAGSDVEGETPTTSEVPEAAVSCGVESGGEARMEEWRIEGHTYMGRRVARTFSEGRGKETTIIGTISRWVPADGGARSLAARSCVEAWRPPPLTTLTILAV